LKTLQLLLVVFAVRVAAQVPRQYDAPIFENAFVRAHIATLNSVEHYRSTVDGPQLLYCLGAFAIVRSDGDGAAERCARGQLAFQESGWLDFKSDGDPRPDMLVVEIKQPIAGDFFVSRDDGTRVAPEVYRVMLDNAVVRVVEMRLPAGQRTRVHRQAARTLLVPLTAARVRIATTGGRFQEIALAARVPRWTADTEEHSVENSGSTELRAIVVELK
jgi:hypothetical protein